MILYYSNYCEHCKNLLSEISRSSIKEDIHFLCIDKRIKKNGVNYIQLENGQEILIPPNIKRVPSILLLNRGNTVVEGEQVNSYIIKKTEQVNIQATNNNGEPLAFSLNDFGAIISDSFSFLDQGSDEMSAKGSGGLRQMHNYVAIGQSDTIETPPEDYVPDKIGGDMSLDKLRMMREKDVPRQQMRVG